MADEAPVVVGLTIESMSVAEIDAYLKDLPELQRTTLDALRTAILKVVPSAEQCISYRVPAFRIDGSVVAGFAAFKNHMSYLPFSGSVLPRMKKQLRGREHTKSALHFTPNSPLPSELVANMIRMRLAEISDRHGTSA